MSGTFARKKFRVLDSGDFDRVSLAKPVADRDSGSAQHRPQAQRRLAKNPSLLIRRQERELLAGVGDETLIAAIIAGGEVRTPHQTLRSECVDQVAEKIDDCRGTVLGRGS